MSFQYIIVRSGVDVDWSFNFGTQGQLTLKTTSLSCGDILITKESWESQGKGRIIDLLLGQGRLVGTSIPTLGIHTHTVWQKPKVH